MVEDRLEGQLCKKQTHCASVDEFKDFFEELYTCDDDEEIEKIRNSESQVNIPLLDDPF